MRTVLTIFTALALTCLTVLAQQAGQDYQYSQACARKNPAANAAIAAFCNKKIDGRYSDTIMCPGPRSSRGVVKQGVRAKITGNCSPQQWIPGQYCLLQFHYICATGGARGMGSRSYGNGGCQTWTLEWANPGVGALLGMGKRDDEGVEGEGDGEAEPEE
ncbi:hypothetical protein Slin15195_G109240 [Septoria linicola]|uniref:Uncharacterized protein n=1 Tax=Septoria linicola TaxID=215465 RepID=A0A9Q9AYS8_9PEZI|nr:hypothetical protein Slin15195_G109240 [Septoria linicola]